jgi:hypothetical protein
MARIIIFRAMYEYGQEDTAGEGGAIWICFLGVDFFLMRWYALYMLDDRLNAGRERILASYPRGYQWKMR